MEVIQAHLRSIVGVMPWIQNNKYISFSRSLGRRLLTVCYCLICLAQNIIKINCNDWTFRHASGRLKTMASDSWNPEVADSDLQMTRLRPHLSLSYLSKAHSGWHSQNDIYLMTSFLSYKTTLQKFRIKQFAEPAKQESINRCSLQIQPNQLKLTLPVSTS